MGDLKKKRNDEPGCQDGLSPEEECIIEGLRRAIQKFYEIQDAKLEESKDKEK